MARQTQDILGERGEAIFSLLMTDFGSYDSPLFQPVFLGAKWHYVDFIVELIGVESFTPFFFAQVKATRQGYTKRPKRLKVKVTQQRLQGLVSYPAPTYIVGIDERSEQGYIVSANGEHLSSMSSLSTQFSINQNTREMLWREVRDFWSHNDIRRQLASQFSDPDWR